MPGGVPPCCAARRKGRGAGALAALSGLHYWPCDTGPHSPWRARAARSLAAAQQSPLFFRSVFFFTSRHGSSTHFAKLPCSSLNAAVRGRARERERQAEGEMEGPRPRPRAPRGPAWAASLRSMLGQREQCRPQCVRAIRADSHSAREERRICCVAGLQIRSSCKGRKRVGPWCMA